MYYSWLAGAVNALQIELEHYKKLSQEQKEIIEQLTGTGQLKGYVYMHPFDVHELYNNAKPWEMCFINRKDYVCGDVHFGGRVLRPSVNIPVASKNFK